MGYRVANATLALGLVTAGVTVATPGVCAAVVRSCWNAAKSVGDRSWPTSSNGPLKPGPNPLARAV